MKKPLTITLVAICSFFLVASLASAARNSGGVTLNNPESVKSVGPKRAKIVNGKLIPPRNAPTRIEKVIQAANKISDKPYIYGGGHKSFKSRGYDCSGAVSYALRGGKFLASPLNSSGLMSWGRRGRGRWMTVFSNPGHAFIIVAGFRFDTSGSNQSGPRWQKNLNRSSWSKFKKRRVSGF